MVELLIGFFIAMYATRMWFYMDCYFDDYRLIESACLYSPNSWFAWHMRAMLRFNTESYKEALILWTMARLISPTEFKINFNLATMLYKSGYKDEAMQYLKVAEDNIPEGQEDAKRMVKEWKQGTISILT
jgi:tetratricopeptide (TPR) repeat protein